VNEYDLALWSDHNGDPYIGPGRVGHVVRISANPRMTIVNEFTDGGTYPHSDCAPACILSRLDDAGIHPNADEIEVLAGTGPNGTRFPGMIHAYAHFGVPAVESAHAPAPGYVMNPAGGRILPPSAFPDYLAASQGGCLVLPAPAPVPVPPPEELPMGAPLPPILATTTRGPGEGPDPRGPGAVYLVENWPAGPKRWISAPAYLPPYLSVCGPVRTVNAFILDRMREDPKIGATYLAAGSATYLERTTATPDPIS